MFALLSAPVAALLVVLIGQSLASSTSAATPTATVPPAATSRSDVEESDRPPLGHAPHDHGGFDPAGPSTLLGEEDGVIPDGVSAFDDTFPGVVNLDPELLRAVRDATMDAADRGVKVVVNSGWRSREYQDRLLEDAAREYGSEEEAARWVATAETSAHVSGDAVDIGPADARAWLAEHGADYGLCQIYDNEPWHFELRPEALGRNCPATYADPTHDPRMRP